VGIFLRGYVFFLGVEKMHIAAFLKKTLANRFNAFSRFTCVFGLKLNQTLAEKGRLSLGILPLENLC